MVRDVGLAEELAQDAFVTALSEWPRAGVPANPGAWLNAAAKRRAIDRLRRDRMLARKHAEIGRDLSEEDEAGIAAIEAAMDDDVGDELLGLIFTACHPVLSPDARVALTLRLIGGLTTDEIARAYLVSEATVAQRIVRAKRALGKAGLSFEVPRGSDRRDRLSSVLEVVYLIFNEGYSATAGGDLTRPALCAEAQRLGRILAGLAPDEPEVFGLLALMETSGVAPGGSPRSGWDADSPDRAEPGPVGPAADPSGPFRPGARRQPWAGRTVPMPCRPRSPPATRGRTGRRRPIGEGSRGSTMRFGWSCPRRWSISTGPWPTAWPSDRRPASRSLTKSTGMQI